MGEFINCAAERVCQFSDRHRFGLLSISIGVVYLWFGALKLFPSWSPAEDLALETLSMIVFHTIDNNVLLMLLACVEVFIGLSLIFRFTTKPVMLLVLIHMFGTMIPLFFMTSITFNKPPFGFSIIGQYILKNIVIIAGLLIVFSKQIKPIKPLSNEETI